MKYALTVVHPVLFMYLSFVGCRKEYFKKALGIDFELDEILIRDYSLYWNYENNIQFNKAFLKNRTLNQAVSHFIRSVSQKAGTLEKTAEQIALVKMWETDDSNQLQKVFDTYIQNYLLIMPFLFQFWNVEYLLLTQLKNDFNSIFGQKKGEPTLQKVLIPFKDTYFTLERQSFEQILLYVSNNQKIQSLIKQDSKLLLSNTAFKHMLNNHIDKFAFTTTNLMLGKPMTSETILERLKNELKTNTREILTQREKHTESDNQIIKKILTQLTSFPDIYERTLLAQEFIYWRNNRLDIPSRSDLLIKPMFEKIARNMGISYNEFVALTYDEIQTWFQDNKKLPTKKELYARKDHAAVYLKNKKITVITDRMKYPKLKLDHETPSLINTRITEEITGSIAYKGKATGKVRRISNKDDISAMQDGEIVVTSMTRPEMILALEKAAAFVTDQGGLLSHAAIVSRELKKPCIIGTQNATKLLKTGDLIEVDATKGIVTKIS